MMKEEGKLVIWPAAIDKNKTRAQGRAISRKSAVADPALDEIEKASKELGLDPVVEKDAAYPRSWWEKSGRVTVLNNAPKTTVLRQISAHIRAARND